MATDINIAGRLHSMASGNVVAGSDEILDDTLGKKQSVINQELYHGAGRPQLNTEDLDYNSDNQLQFANRLYDSESPDGMGYKILRQGDGLTFANHVTDTNTIYEIRYSFDLGGNTVSIPEGCMLRFNGGAVSNGTLVLNETIIEGLSETLGINIKGTIGNDIINADWFTINDGNIQTIFNSKPAKVVFGNRHYSFKNIVLHNSVIIEGSAETEFNPVLIEDVYTDDPYGLKSCFNMLKCDVADAEIIVRNIRFKSETTNIILENWVKDQSKDKYCSKPLLWFTDAKKVVVEGCSFIDIEGNSYQSTDYTYYGNKQSLCLCCWDCDEVVIDGNFMKNLRHDEQFWAIAVEKDIDDLNVTFSNNRIVDMEPDYNSSAFTTVCGSLKLIGNYVENWNYKGSIFNCFGRNNIINNNVIKDSFSTSVFDCCEYGYFYSNSVEASNNVIECTNALAFVTISKSVVLTNNYINAFSFLQALAGATITGEPPYQYFYYSAIKDAVKPNSYIYCDGNDIKLTNYDSSKYIIGAGSYTYGFHVYGRYVSEDIVIFTNNTIVSKEDYSVNDPNGLYNTNGHSPIRLMNVKSATIKGNKIVGTSIGGSITSSKGFIHIIRFDANDDNFHFVLDYFDISDNYFESSSNIGYVILFYNSRYQTHMLHINKLIFERNRGSYNFPLHWGINTIVQELTCQHPLGDLYLGVPIEYLIKTDRDVNILTSTGLSSYFGYESYKFRGRIPGKEVFTFKGFKAYTTYVSSFASFVEEDLTEGQRIENGTQIKIGGTVWKNLSVATYHAGQTFEILEDDTDYASWLGVYWVKLSTIKTVNYASILYAADQSELPTLTDTTLSNSFVAGALAYVWSLKMLACYYNGRWGDVNGRTLGKISGESIDRPVLTLTGDYGYQFYDKTLGKPIYWEGLHWIDSTGAAVTYRVAYYLSNLTSSGALQPPAGEQYDSVLVAADGYTLPATITVTMGDVTLSAGTDYTYNSTTGEVSILGTGGAGGLTNNVNITASGVQQA